MSSKFTVLVDNKAEKPFVSEHGFSILLEIKGKRILFDTGNKDALFHNATESGVSLSGLDVLVLSHGHYDHGGNLAEILQMNPSIQFYAHPDCLIPRWSVQPGHNPRIISLSQEAKNAVRELSSDQVHWCRKPVEIIPDVWITGEVPRTNNFEDTGGPFYRDKYGNTPDLILDDMSLWINNTNTMSIICGCCHSGLKNTIDHIVSYSNHTQIDTLAGGFHLVNADAERLGKTVSFLNSIDIRHAIPSHCTGNTALSLFLKDLHADVTPSTAGLIF